MNNLKLLVLVLLVATVRAAIAEDQQQAAKENSLYARALFASVAQMDKEWGNQPDAPDYHHMLVEADPEITKGLPLQTGTYRVEYLDRVAQIARCKKVRKEFAILKIHPIHDERGNLMITVSVYYLSHKKGRLMYGLSDWSDVEFRFDCDNQEFVVSSVKLGGI